MSAAVPSTAARCTSRLASAVLAVLVMLAAVLSSLALTFAGAASAATLPTLVGDWKFGSGAPVETTGMWSSFNLHGTASVSGGQLVVAGSGNGNGNAATAWADASGYTGPTIGDKTLISWVKLDSSVIRSGAPISLYNHTASPGDVFDAVDYAEVSPGQWMPGSDNSRRANHANGGTTWFSPGYVDTDTTALRQIAISYHGNGNGTQTITGCLNGTQIGSYTADNIQLFDSGSQVLFGPRHEAGGAPVGSINAHIAEDRVYAGAMSCADIASLSSSAPMPSVVAVAASGSPTDATATGLTLKPGQTTTLTATGSWNPGGGYGTSSAAGSTVATDTFTATCLLTNTAPTGALVYSVDGTTWHYAAAGPTLITGPGTVRLAQNDCPNYYGDNTGSVTATLTAPAYAMAPDAGVSGPYPGLMPVNSNYILPNYSLAQKFTATKTGLIYDVQLELSQYAGGATANTTFQIRPYNTVSGVTGRVLGSTTIPAGDFTTPAAWRTEHFAAGVPVQFGVTYALVMLRGAPGVTNNGAWDYQSTTCCTGGLMTNANPTTTAWTPNSYSPNGSRDLLSRIYITAPAFAVTPSYRVDATSLTAFTDGNWSGATVAGVPSGLGTGRMYGPFNATTPTLRVTGLPVHSAVKLTFTLYGISSLDGSGGTTSAPGGCCGPDKLAVTANDDRSSQTLLDSTFSDVGLAQSYPDYYDTAAGPFNGSGAGSEVYTGGNSRYTITRMFTSSSSNVTFTFNGVTGEGYPNEGWGIGSTSVSVDDTQAPTITSTNTPAGAWANRPVEVRFTCTDPAPSSGLTSCPAGTTLTSEGSNQTASAQAIDGAGNVAAVTSAPVSIDLHAPTITPATTDVPTGPNPANPWFNHDVSVTWTCADPVLADGTPGSGVASCPAATSTSGEGAVSVNGFTTDNAGNASGAVTFYARVDKVAPVTTAAIGGTVAPDGSSDASNDSVTVNLTATDSAGSGVHATTYNLDGGPAQTLGDTGAIVITGSGRHTLTYRSSDNAGNTEADRTVAVLVDRGAPILSDPAITPALHSGPFTNVPTTVTYTCTDPVLADGTPGSGIADCSTTPAGTTKLADDGASATVAAALPAPGAYSVNASASDKVGNHTATAQGLPVIIDTAPPTVTPVVTSASSKSAAGWYSSPVTVHFACSDLTGPAGDDGHPTQAATDSGVDPSTCPPDVVVTDDTMGRTLTGHASDNAGNDASSDPVTVKLDQNPPSLTYTLTGAKGPGGVYRGDVTVNWTCNDTGSGLAGNCPADSTITGEGQNLSVSKTVTDNAGNTTTTTAVASIDRTPPTISGGPDRTANAYGWYSSPVTVGFTCNDPITAGSDSAIHSCTDPVTADKDGAAQDVTGTAVDKAGNTANTTRTVNVDQTAPKLTAAVSMASDSGWYSAANRPSLTWTATDPLSGVDDNAWLNKDGEPGPVRHDVSKTLPLPGEGTAVTGTEMASDRAGNTTTTTSAPVKVDLSAPTADASVPAGWSKTAVPVTITASDPALADGSDGSGVASVTYAIDKSDPVTTAGSNPVTATITGDGTHTVTYYATDTAGNAGTSQTATVRIDTTAPQITKTESNDANGAGWHNADVTVTFTCNDPGADNSGLATCSTSADPGSVSGSSGKATTTVNADVAGKTAPALVTGHAADNAGNTADLTDKVLLDKTAPTLSGAPTTTANAAGWYAAPVTVHFTCADSLSGIKTCPAEAVLAGDGPGQSASGAAMDVADNASAPVKVDGINIDTVNPAIAAAVTAGKAGSNSWYTSPVTLHFTCTDPGGDLASGVATCPADATVNADGISTVAGQVIDKAGNTASTSIVVKLDTTPPTISAALGSSSAGSNGWFKAATVHFTCADATSGLTGACPADAVLADGQAVSATGSISDLAGFSSTTTAGPFKVDGTNPVIAFAAHPASYSVDQVVTIVCSRSDATSGIDAAASSCLGSDKTQVASPAAALSPGLTTVSATAIDKAGNSNSATTSYTVTVDGASLDRLLAAYCTGARNNSCNGITAKIDQLASTTGASAKAGVLSALNNQLRAQTGKALTSAQAATISAWAGRL